MNKIFIFTKYNKNGASSRYRFYQYIPYLNQIGIKTVLMPLFPDNYLNRIYNNNNYNFIQFITIFFKRLRQIFSVPKNSIVLIEYELYPYLFCIFEKFLKYRNCKLIFD